jgi:hypothetical protein
MIRIPHWRKADVSDVIERTKARMRALGRRGLFRREYEGTTLREHLGLPRPDNQFFPLSSSSRAA